MSPLRQQMQNDMVIRGMAGRTQESYLSAVRGLAKYYRRPPDAVSVEEVQSYVLHFLQEQGLSASTCSLVANGLRFGILPPPSQTTPEAAPDLEPGGDRPALRVTTHLKHRVLASIQRFSPTDFIRRGSAPCCTRVFVARRIKSYSLGVMGETS